MPKHYISYKGGSLSNDKNLHTFSDVKIRDIPEYVPWSLNKTLTSFTKFYVGNVTKNYQNRYDWEPPNNDTDKFIQKNGTSVNLGYLIPLVQLALFDIQNNFLSNPYALTYCESSKFKLGDDSPKLSDLLNKKLGTILFPDVDFQQYHSAEPRFGLWLDKNWNSLLEKFNTHNYICFLIQFDSSVFIPPLLDFIFKELKSYFDIEFEIKDNIIDYDILNLNFLNKDYDKKYYKSYYFWSWIIDFMFPKEKKSLTLYQDDSQ